jgi:hypothetical protein
LLVVPLASKLLFNIAEAAKIVVFCTRLLSIWLFHSHGKSSIQRQYSSRLLHCYLNLDVQS